MLIGYLDENKVKPFTIILPKLNVESYEGETKWMYILTEDEKLLKTSNFIWNDVNNSTNYEFDS